MEIDEEILERIVILKNASYSLGEVFNEVYSGKNCYHELSQFEDINLLKELDKLRIFPSEEDKLWMLTDKIIKTNFFDSGKEHNCYWNDSFYLANRFNLIERDKKKSAIVALWNGRNGYWEWETHHEFNNTELLSDMGIIKKEEAIKLGFYSNAYCNLTKELHDKIKDYFKLTNDDLRAARWINRSVWEKEQKHKEGKQELKIKFNLDF